ncbi:ATP-binding protein [Enterococcus gilvus]|uniref:ATP-binding protein n=1 Tax=Enterococcus gilvus TaxID=160453 RepID=UPI00345EE359
MEFPLLNELKETALICPIHGCPLVQLRDLEPFCIECRKQQLIEAEQSEAKLASMKHQRRRTIEVLKTDSIVGDSKLWTASFDTYVPDGKESTDALKLARLSAGGYMKSLEEEKRCQRIIANKELDESVREQAKKELSELDKFNTIFSGVPGVGKSHLAMAMLQAVNQHSNELVSCLFISMNDMFRLIKASFSDRQSKYTELNMTDLLSKVDLLVLDDLGSESSFKRENREAGEYIQNVIFGVLNARQRTIITTNLNSEELEEIYNPKITSRIYKAVDDHIIKFTKKTQDKRSRPKF